MPQTNPSKAWGYKNIIVGRKLNFLLKAVIDHIHLHTVEFFFTPANHFPMVAMWVGYVGFQSSNSMRTLTSNPPGRVSG